MEILSVKKYGFRLKASVHKSGKLGFTGGTSQVMGLSKDCKVVFGVEDKASGILYVAKTAMDNEDAFSLSFGGGYCVVNARGLFDMLDIDYVTQAIIYTLKRVPNKDKEMGGEAYMMTPRIKPRTDADTDEMDED